MAQSVKKPPASAGDTDDAGSVPGSRKSTGDRAPKPGILAWGFHGQRSLPGYSAWGHEELDVTECACTPHQMAMKDALRFILHRVGMSLSRDFTFISHSLRLLLLLLLLLLLSCFSHV